MNSADSLHAEKNIYTFVTRLISLLEPRMRLQFVSLLIPMLIIAVLEIASIAMVVPLIQAVLGGKAGEAGGAVLNLVSGLIAPGKAGDVVWVGTLFVALFLAKNIALLAMTYLIYWTTLLNLGRFQASLFDFYLHAPYEFYLSSNSAEIIRNFIINSGQAFEAVRTLLNTFMEVVLVLAAFSLLVLIDPVIALGVTALLILAGILLYRILGPKIQEWGRIKWAREAEMIQAINHGTGSIRDTKILGCQAMLTKAFFGIARQLAVVRTLTGTAQQFPRLLVEVLVVIGFMVVILISSVGTWAISEIASVAGLFGMAMLRLMPSANRIMSNFNSLRGAAAVVNDLFETTRTIMRDREESVEKTSETPILFRDNLRLDKVAYSYPNSNVAVVHDIDLTIQRGEFIGLVGPSGAGKSTLVDIILGFLPPTSGQILVDDREITASRRTWQRHFGYVPQQIFIIDDSLRRNVAFGIEDDAIDDHRIWKILEDTGIADLVRGWPAGLDTRLGERGARLSGGQIQRVGIARALYRDPEILVLDEATSALDSETEKAIAETIRHLAGSNTVIVIAHRLSTVQRADRLVMMVDGRIQATGRFQELFDGNELFRNMVRHGTLDLQVQEDLT